MFGRTKTSQPEPSSDLSGPKQGGKGRPTPSRRESESRNRRPLVGAAPARPGATKEERKAARNAQKATMAAERARSREALVTGDERYLPVRDKGPARRYARDYVDARHNVGEYLLPAALIILVLGLLPNYTLKAASAIMLYALMLIVFVDSILIRRKVNKLATEKFAEKAAGAGGYAMMRALQLRRTRLPRPQVKRGEYPH